jgi:hypothetical protein
VVSGVCVEGDGTNTFLWTDPWLAGVPLSMRFPRLFDLIETRSSSVAAMCSLGLMSEGRRVCGGDHCGRVRRC